MWFRKGKSAFAWLEDREKADEKKKTLLKRLLATRQAKKATAEVSVDCPTSAVGALASETVAPPPVDARTIRLLGGGKAMRVYQDDAETPLVPSDPLLRLVNIYLEAAATQEAYQVLMWPVAPQVLPLVHALATVEYWNVGSKAGVRGLFFPAKDNTFHPLNHLTMDRKDLERHARAFIQIKAMPDKDPVLFRAVNTIEVLPTLNDLLPHFNRLKKGDEWAPYDDHLLEHTLRKVNRYSQKTALRSNCAVLGAPKTAPDALFALGYQLDREDLRQGLRSLGPIGMPQACLINATRAIRLPVPNLLAIVRQFFRATLAEFPRERPGIVVVADDPGVSFRIRELVEKESERAIRHDSNTAPLRLIFRPIACQEGGELGQLLKPEGSGEPAAPLPRKFRVEIKDTDAARIVKALHQIRRQLKLDDQSGRPLSNAATFLHRLAGLPAGNCDVEAWLDERAADEGLRRRLAWTSQRGALIEFIKGGRAGLCEEKLESTLKVADKLVENYREATPMALALAAEVAVAAATARLALVFTRPMLRLLGERFLRRQIFPNGKLFEDLTPRLQLISTKQLREHARSGWASRYVFVGMDDEALRALMTENGIPPESVLLLTQRTALYTGWTLRPIFDENEFRRFKPRLEHILRQIDTWLGEEDVPLLRTDDFVLPSFDFSAALPTREDDSEAYRIALEGGESIYRSPGATAYVYDPVADIHSKSGFVPKEIRSLEVGEQLFVMSEALHDQVEEALRAAGVPISRDKPFEQQLREYHRAVLRSLSERFPGANLAVQVAALRKQLVKQFPDQAKDFSNVRHWVDLGNAPNTPFDELRPQAPRHFKVFAAFASTLGLSTTETEFFWVAAIHPIRVNRRIDGRYVSDVYARILFRDPESAMVHAKLSAKNIAELIAEARRNVFTIAAIEEPPQTRTTV